MRRLNIGLDFDSVITDSTGLKAEYAKRLYGVDIPAAIFKWYTTVPQGLLTSEQYQRVQHAVHNGERDNERMPAVPGALTYIPRLLAQGHNLKVVTGRSGLSADLARRYIERRELPIPLVGVGSKQSKAPELVGFDVFADDDLDKLEPLVGVVEHRYLFGWEYNKHIDPGSVACRVSGWDDLYERIQRIAEETR